MIVQRTTETLASLVGGRDYDCTSLIDCDLAVLPTFNNEFGYCRTIDASEDISIGKKSTLVPQA